MGNQKQGDSQSQENKKDKKNKPYSFFYFTPKQLVIEKGHGRITVEQEAIETYERILTGEIKSFSPHFFDGSRYKKIRALIKYLIEEKLKITPEEALNIIDEKFLRDWKLKQCIKFVKKPAGFYPALAPRLLIYDAYPELRQETEEEALERIYNAVLTGKEKSFPINYFKNELGEYRAILAIRYMVEKVLGYKIPDELKKVTRKDFNNYGLKILFNTVFNGLDEAMEKTYPGLW